MRKKSLMILGMVCLFLFITSVVRAEKLSVPACGFIAAGHQAEQLQIDTAYGGYIYRKDTIENIFFTPVYLPHGKIIKWMRFHCIDNESSYSIRCVLIRINKYTGSPQIIYDIYTSGDSASVRHFTDPFPANPAWTLVNNDVCTYHVAIVFSGSGPSSPVGIDRTVYGITICYE